jgi:hypothetical protein
MTTPTSREIQEQTSALVKSATNQSMLFDIMRKLEDLFHQQKIEMDRQAGFMALDTSLQSQKQFIVTIQKEKAYLSENQKKKWESIYQYYSEAQSWRTSTAPMTASDYLSLPADITAMNRTLLTRKETHRVMRALNDTAYMCKKKQEMIRLFQNAQYDESIPTKYDEDLAHCDECEPICNAERFLFGAEEDCGTSTTTKRKRDILAFKADLAKLIATTNFTILRPLQKLQIHITQITRHGIVSSDAPMPASAGVSMDEESTTASILNEQIAILLHIFKFIPTDDHLFRGISGVQDIKLSKIETTKNEILDTIRRTHRTWTIMSTAEVTTRQLVAMIRTLDAAVYDLLLIVGMSRMIALLLLTTHAEIQDRASGIIEAIAITESDSTQREYQRCITINNSWPNALHAYNRSLPGNLEYPAIFCVGIYLSMTSVISTKDLEQILPPHSDFHAHLDDPAAEKQGSGGLCAKIYSDAVTELIATHKVTVDGQTSKRRL